MPNVLNLNYLAEHFGLTLLCILHPRYNSILAENRMGDTFSLKITDKVSYIQHLDRSRYDSTDLFRFKVIFNPVKCQIDGVFVNAVCHPHVMLT